jgi:hypothetical protein
MTSEDSKGHLWIAMVGDQLLILYRQFLVEINDLLNSEKVLRIARFLCG